MKYKFDPMIWEKRLKGKWKKKEKTVVVKIVSINILIKLIT